MPFENATQVEFLRNAVRFPCIPWFYRRLLRIRCFPLIIGEEFSFTEMPPPLDSAWLSLIVLSLIVGEETLIQMPPPAPSAWR